MTSPTEILFVDPELDDLTTVLRGLRPGVEAVVLETGSPPARQMAEALAGREGLAAVHVMAHGAPGHVIFSGGVWSAGSLEWDAGDLAAIGGALSDSGELRLWSCNTAAGATGAAFIEQLAERAGADVAAAEGRVGAAGLGGSWDLDQHAARPTPQSPLTAAGMQAFEGVLVIETWKGTGSTNTPSNGNWSTAADWSGSPAREPISGDAAVLGGNGSNPTYAVTFDATDSILTLSITDPNATLIFIIAVRISRSPAAQPEPWVILVL